MKEKRKNLLKLTSILLVILVFIGCNIETKDGNIVICKNELKHERIINLKDFNAYKTFSLKMHYGEVKLSKGENFDLQVKIFEEVKDDITVSLNKGDLVCNSKSNKKFAVGSISGTVPVNTSIELDSGAGDIFLSGFENKYINIDTAAGNVTISNCLCEKELDINTGAGNISIEKVNSFTITLDSGTGNISLSEVDANEIDCGTGVGNISAFSSIANQVSFDTGIGNISTVDCNFNEKKFNTGIGKIRDSNTNKQ